MYWINGQRHDALAPSDRGLQFGDGCFTTARVIDGKIELLPWHLERLQQAAQRLMLPATDWPLSSARWRRRQNQFRSAWSKRY